MRWRGGRKPVRQNFTEVLRLEITGFQTLPCRDLKGQERRVLLSPVNVGIAYGAGNHGPHHRALYGSSGIKIDQIDDLVLSDPVELSKQFLGKEVAAL